MTTDASIRIDIGGLIVYTSLTDVLVGYGPDFGAILVAVRLHSIAATQLGGGSAVDEGDSKA
jgi:hypothetical protein